MSSSQAITWLLVFAFVGLTVALAYRITLWRKGQGKGPDLSYLSGLGLLLRIPKRYFVDLHHIVIRDSYMAYTHILVAGGTIVVFVLLLGGYLFAPNNYILTWLLTWGLKISLLLVLCGASLVLARRIFFARKGIKRLSGGKWNFVPVALFALVLGLGLLILNSGQSKLFYPYTTQVQFAALFVASLSMFELFWAGVFNRPFKHIFVGSLNLAFHPRQERFSSPDRIAADLAPLDLNQGQLGVRTIQDFAWNRLLNFDSCVECGKCEAACPAFAAEQPLNPKKLIQDLVASLEARAAIGYAGSPTPIIEALAKGETYSAEEPIVGSSIQADTLWSCTSCRACVYECPMMVEHVDAIVDLRRNLTMRKGELPVKSFAALENLRHTDNPDGNNPHHRVNWSVDLQVPQLAEGDETDVLLWAGQAAFELRNQNTLRHLVTLLNKAGVKFALLGNQELDSGDLARRLGDEVLFEDLAQRNILLLGKINFNSIVTADPHVYNILHNEYPAYGGNYEVYHHTEYLLKLIQEGKLNLSPKRSNEKMTFHDPCYLARYNGITQAPRELLNLIGIDFVEMERSAMKSRCCGWGGGAAYSDIAGKRRIPDMRMDDVREVAAEKLVVACPNCMTMLEGVVEPRPKVMDIVEVLSEAVA